MNLKVRKVAGQVAAVALAKAMAKVTELLGRQWCSVKHSYLPRQVDELELTVRRCSLASVTRRVA